MSKLATKFIESFVEDMRNNNSYEHVERMLLDERNQTYNDLKKMSLFSAWRTVQWIGHTGDAYRYVFAERDAKKYYLEDGSLDEEYLEQKYRIAIGEPEGKDYVKETYEDLFANIWNVKREVSELSKLFEHSNNLLHNTKVYEECDGNLRLVFEDKSLKSFNLNSYFIANDSDVLIMDESLWPQNEQIYQMNKKDKNTVEKELTKYKKDEKITYLDYEKIFQYTIGKPKYIQYYMEQLPEEVLKKYKDKKWTFSLVIIFMYEKRTCAYTAKDEGYVDMLIDYDIPLDIEGDK